ncbi:hypothetical protein T4E_6095 [Trichinella pseudospiralis]|uniref:Uncharacterized protein n=1 Tax=Trichinella pseudospiralis TaxID=6337 RepID=A0A0V0XSE7_TRIPS|nr:hypothetical protein T4E_6095 [Trichinella pseudospiralis]
MDSALSIPHPVVEPHNLRRNSSGRRIRKTTAQAAPLDTSLQAHGRLSNYFTPSTLDLPYDIRCRHKARSCLSTAARQSSTHCWGDPSNTRIAFRSHDFTTLYPIAMSAIA